MPYRPTDFTQVNHPVNRVLIAKALMLLGAGEHDRVADMFCGLGNFSRPMASRSRSVVGGEGSAALSARDSAADTVHILSARPTGLPLVLFGTPATQEPDYVGD